MKCSLCGDEIRTIDEYREFAEVLEVCTKCYRELVDLTRETGGEIETLAEIEHERFVDSVSSVYA